MQSKTGLFRTVMAAAVGLLACAALAGGQRGNSVVGRWQYKRGAQEIVMEFRTDGKFHQSVKTADGPKDVRGHYTLNGELLEVLPDGYMLPEQIKCRFQDADTLALTYATGETILARRVQSSQESSPSPSGVAPEMVSGATHKPERLLLARAWEPNEKAFSILSPMGWKLAGGEFRVNALQMNGVGNTISPKCDFSLRSDDQGAIMIRWLPSWNYADLTYSRTGSGFFRPGQYYQGMLVKPILDARQFLTEILRNERPQASGFRVIAEDPMNEVTAAFASQAEVINANLRRLNAAPMRFDSRAMLVEYSEGDRRYREVLMTTIVDNRGTALQWSNENTMMYRAPAAGFESWKPILDMIQLSREMNPQWVASVEKGMGPRAKAALETEQYIERLRSEILENRRKRNVTTGFEPLLFVTGLAEYRNPFTGELEHGTPAYRFRWESKQGEILYTDKEGFDPNHFGEFMGRDWRLSESVQPGE